MAHIDLPPAFERSNLVELVSVDDSKIVNVSLYSGHAEITRLFRFKVKMGQNQVHITGLPAVVDGETLRVQGRGAATIHDVTLSRIPLPAVNVSTEHTALTRKRDSLEEAIQRCKTAKESIATYLRTLSVQHVEASNLADILEKYELEGRKLTERSLNLQAEMKTVEADLEVEKQKTRNQVPRNLSQSDWKTTIGVFSETEDEVEITLIYMVRSATWSAGYDIRVDTQTKETPIKLVYKAVIKQRTGEAWEDVPLTLETATPTFGVAIPELQPWRLSANRPGVLHTMVLSAQPTSGRTIRRSLAPPQRRIIPEAASIVSDDDVQPEMAHQFTRVSSNSTVNATFRIPGLITIPSDEQAHNVTIVQLELEAALSWKAVPTLDTKTHLTAKIKNASEYTFLPGTASIYVDGSFISKSPVPAVSPQESFDCPLGLDPSIRITYHPQSKKTFKSGFYQKTVTHSYTQLITIFNTKTTGIENLKVIDRFPVSQDSDISVKYITPALTLPSVATSSEGSGKRSVVPPLTVGEGVVAQWDGADDPSTDVSALGKDGKLNWVCAVPAQGKINLALKWDVVAPASLNIDGL